MIDTYVKEFTAFVQSCTKSGDFFKIVLSDTAFFPEGGGQYADRGILKVGEKEIEVKDVQIENGNVFHYTNDPIEEGTKVLGVLDWELRFMRMQNHTGEHIVSGIINKTYGYDNIGFALTDDDVTCDYNGDFSKEDLKQIEKDANKAVFENRKITVSYPDADVLKSLSYRSKLDLTENVRLVTIDGVDCCACCAPHVMTTAEVGLIKIVNVEKSHGGTRLHLRCGSLALLDYDEKQEQCAKIGEALCARQYELFDYVTNLQNNNDNLTYKISQLSKKLALTKLELIDKVEGNLVVSIDDADKDALLALANGGREKVTKLFVALTETSENNFRYMITSADTEIKLSKMAKEINDALNGRGGGKDELIQGTFACSLKEIEDYFA